MPRRPLWSRLGRWIDGSPPDVDVLARRLAAVRKKLPPPVFWLMGKSQAGKSAVARALTGDETIAIGAGFAPCTSESRVVDFPDSGSPLFRFLDTRGLGEVGYTSEDDLRRFSQAAQVVLAVVNVMDPDQEAVYRALDWVARKRPRLPAILVQTSLHEGYTDPGMEHVLPYPFLQPDWPTQVPDALARALQSQRERFRDRITASVAVDFTDPADGYTPRYYGAEALWAAMEEAYPSGLRNAMAEAHHFDDLFRQRVQPMIIGHAVTAALAELVPVPLVAAPVVLGLQGRLCRSIAKVYEQPLDRRQWAEIGAAVGGGVASQLVIRQVGKLVPAVGVAMAAAGTGATTYALGQVLCLYFRRVRDGAAPGRDQLREFYADELGRGRQVVGEILKARRQS